MGASELEKAIMRIPGVEACRVKGRQQEPDEIHVLAQPGKPAKQIVRDIQSVAIASLGIDLDRRVISVVQLDQGTLAGGDRASIEDVGEQIDGSHATATVTLKWHDDLLKASATGPASPATRLQLVADATLRAIAEALNSEVALGVAGVAITNIGSHQVAIAQVVLVDGKAERSLVGSSIVDSDPSRAMVRAVLDAVNRQIPALRR